MCVKFTRSLKNLSFTVSGEPKCVQKLMGGWLLITASDEGRSLLRCYAMSSGKQLLTIWRIIVPSDLGRSCPLCMECLTLKTKTQLSFRMCVITHQLMCHIQEDLHLSDATQRTSNFVVCQISSRCSPYLHMTSSCGNTQTYFCFPSGICGPMTEWVFKHSSLKCAHLVFYLLNGIQECCTNLLLLDWCVDFMYASLHGLAKPCENMFPPNDILSADDLWCTLTAVSCMRWSWYAVSVVICGLKVIVLLQGQRTCQTGCAYWGQTIGANFLPTAASCLWSNN